ncbi:hypothetical protein LJC47_04440 [Desulfosarcina sp. OttesenSCG-928-B08]|nr:hypothetical protein [Desulfosarcina sp. OttesenSCG-928-B08]
MKIDKVGKSVKTSSQYVAFWIQKQKNVKEETLTDWFLFDTSEKIPCISYKAFSRHEESRESGADWEWWVIFDVGAVKFRVQAKKLDASKDCYSSLAYTPRGRTELQIDRLIDDAHRSHSFPLYAFYVDSGKGTICAGGIVDEGVYISSAKTIYYSFIASGKNKVLQFDVIGKSIPVSCLFCCPIRINNSGMPLYSVLLHYFKEAWSDQGDREFSYQNNPEFPGWHDTLPPYVESFIGDTKKIEFDVWEREFRHNIEGVNSIVAYDLRTDNLDSWKKS